MGRSFHICPVSARIGNRNEASEINLFAINKYILNIGITPVLATTTTWVATKKVLGSV